MALGIAFSFGDRTVVTVVSGSRLDAASQVEVESQRNYGSCSIVIRDC
jgi:hypothetical protein